MPKKRQSYPNKTTQYCIEKDLEKLKQSISESPDSVFKTDSVGNTPGSADLMDENG